jgi:flagellar basal-body rod protein FlgB
MSGPLFDRTLQASQVALGGLSRRQQVIANNIANVDTPGYAATDVQFEAALGRAIGQQQTGQISLARTDPRHLPVRQADLSSVRPAVSMQTGKAARVDGNNVDIDAEMVRLAEAQIGYNAVTQATNTKLSILRTAVSDGRK